MLACVGWRFLGAQSNKAGEDRETARRLGREQLERVIAASPVSRAPDKTAMLCRL